MLSWILSEKRVNKRLKISFSSSPSFRGLAGGGSPLNKRAGKETELSDTFDVNLKSPC